ncbi:hypothetical protein HDU67_001225 [Dinochytrium kinnereticum]|nr:hypothetical protein HDU67_001225 [Dinochytrium kinnereticum]
MPPLCKLKEGDVDVTPVFKKDAHDVAANTIVQVSSGPPMDPRFFYATTHSTTYKPMENALLKSPINGVDSDYLQMRMGLMKLNFKRGVKQGTGYSKNVLPYVEYDKKVDEGPHFSNPASKSVTIDHYQTPKYPPNALNNPDLGIAPMVSSGFTRLPKFPVTEDGTNHREKESEMKSSYAEKRLRLKTAAFDKRRITSSDSAFVNDVGEIKSLGNPNEPDFNRYAVSLALDLNIEFYDAFIADNISQPTPGPNPPPDWRTLAPTKMTDDGYSRSTRPVDPLKRDPDSLINARFAEEKANSGLRRRDPAEWVHNQDPRAKKSLSRVIHVPLDPLDAVRAAHNPSTAKIGSKEPTGAVQNNPKFVFVSEPSPAERFSTETERRFQAPVDPFSFNALKCNYVTDSGFTSGNNFHYTPKAKSDSDIFGAMHPTVAKHNWIRERGLHTVKPNRNSFAYSLV